VPALHDAVGVRPPGEALASSAMPALTEAEVGELFGDALPIFRGYLMRAHAAGGSSALDSAVDVLCAAFYARLALSDRSTYYRTGGQLQHGSLRMVVHEAIRGARGPTMTPSQVSEACNLAGHAIPKWKVNRTLFDLERIGLLSRVSRGRYSKAAQPGSATRRQLDWEAPS